MSGGDPAEDRPTRRELLAGGAAGAVIFAGAAGAGAAGAASALLAPGTAAAAGTATALDPAGAEVDRLQRLARVELLLIYCYRHVLASPVITPSVRETLAPFVGQEEAHLAALSRQLRARGGAIPSGPASPAAADRDLAHRQIAGRLGQLQGEHDAVRLLAAVERVAIGAYFVALLKLSDRRLVELCCQIMANEGQHDAVLMLQLPPHKIQRAAPYGLMQGRQ